VDCEEYFGRLLPHYTTEKRHKNEKFFGIQHIATV